MAMLYVNIYSVTRAYGGPEEGGWWYDSREPLESIPASKNSRIARKKLKAIKEATKNPKTKNKIYVSDSFDWDYEATDPNDMTGCYGGEDIEVYLEPHKARYNPRPYYE